MDTERSVNEWNQKITQLRSDLIEAEKKENNQAVKIGVVSVLFLGMPCGIVVSEPFDGIAAGVATCVAISAAFLAGYVVTVREERRKIYASEWIKQSIEKAYEARDRQDP